MQTSKRWLILSHGFNMDGRAASQTITDKIPYLLKAGIELTVVSAKTGAKDSTVKHYQLWPWGPSGFRFDFRHWFQSNFGRGWLYVVLTGLVSFLLMPFMFLEKLLVGLPGYWSWAMPATLKTWWLVKLGKIDLVYSTGGAWSAILAGWWVKKLTGVRWIVEVHDPLVHRGEKKNTSSKNDKFQAWLEKKICQDADLVWWFTEGALVYAQERCPELGDRGFSILAGSEKSSVSVQYQKSGWLNFNHFGSLSGTRSLVPFLRGLLTLCDSHPEALEILKVNVYGVLDLDGQALKLVRAEPRLKQIVKVHGRLEKDESMGLSGRERVCAEMQRSDVLLLLHGEDSWCEEYIPSKVYEYFWAERPVFGLTHNNMELNRLVTQRGGYVAETAESVAIVAQLEEIWQDWVSGSLVVIKQEKISIALTVEKILKRVNDSLEDSGAQVKKDPVDKASFEQKGHYKKVYYRLLRYVFPHWKLFLLSTIGFVFYAAMQPLFAMTIDHVVDALNASDRESINLLPLFFIGLFLIRGVGSFVGNYFLAIVSGNVVHQLRREIFNQCTRLPVKYFDLNNSGQLMSRITHNVNEVTTATTDSVKTLIREGLTAFCLLVYLVYVNWLLSLTFLLVAPFLVFLIKYVSRRLRFLSKKMQGSVGDMSHITSELVHGQRSVRSFGGELYEQKRFAEASDYSRRQFIKFTVTHAINSPLTQFILSIALALLMYLALGAMEYVETGTIIGYLTAAFLLPKPIRSLSDANVGIQRGIAAAESLFEVLDEPVELDKGEARVNKSLGDLEFKNVTFTYHKAEAPALENLSFKIRAGQTVAIVGSSGAGKTTLINLILRFYSCGQGEIRLDGIAINDYNLADYRRQITLVEQVTMLFNDTVSNNIAYGVESSQQNVGRIKQAAKAAYADSFIESLPGGYNEEVGEQGVTLSGGQRQRIALARAMYKDAPILVLDEATSALDTESERYVKKALEKLQQGKTTIVIAHRLSTIRNADLIFVMDKGRLVDQGTHAELLEQSSIYKQLNKTVT